MALEGILAAIDDETSKVVAAIDDEADRRCRSVTADAVSKAEAERRRLAHSKDELARLAAARIVNRSVLEADRVLRSEQEALFSEAVAQVVERCRAVREDPGYERLLGRLLDEAVGVLDGAATLEVDALDLEPARRICGLRNLSISIESRLQTSGGVRLVSDDGRAVLNTLESRIDKAIPALRQLAVEMCPELVDVG
jgi:vacuolar-type H+-ATPase subunit E/Vma4